MKKKKNIVIVIIILIGIALLFLATGSFISFTSKEKDKNTELAIKDKKEVSKESCYKGLCIDKITIEEYKDVSGGEILFYVSNKGEDTMDVTSLELSLNDTIVKKFDSVKLIPTDEFSVSISVSDKELKELKDLKNYTLREAQETNTEQEIEVEQ